MIRLPVRGFGLRGRGGGQVFIVGARRMELRYKRASHAEPSLLCVVLTGGGKPAVFCAIHPHPWPTRNSKSSENYYWAEKHPRHPMTRKALSGQLALFGFDRTKSGRLLAAFRNRDIPDGRRRPKGNRLYAGLLKRADNRLELVLFTRRGRCERETLLLDGLRRTYDSRSHRSIIKTRQSSRLTPQWPGVLWAEPWENAAAHCERIRDIIDRLGFPPGMVDSAVGQERTRA